MTDQKERFKNPWKGSPGYVFLGRHAGGRYGTSGYREVVHHDLYALDIKPSSSVSFGARYGDKAHEYCSGEARIQEGQWELFGGKEIAQAAFLFFANHRSYVPEKSVNPKTWVIEVREQVSWFATIMEAKLRDNDAKPGWDTTSFDTLHSLVMAEAKELLEVINQCSEDVSTSLEGIVKEAADVANYAMMIADNARHSPFYNEEKKK